VNDPAADLAERYLRCTICVASWRVGVGDEEHTVDDRSEDEGWLRRQWDPSATIHADVVGGIRHRRGAYRTNLI
jgi:hypothetical protein